MLNELSPVLAFPSAPSRPAGRRGPIAWRLAIPVIGGASIGLWVLVGKAVLLLVA